MVENDKRESGDVGENRHKKVRIMMPPLDSYLMPIEEFAACQPEDIGARMIEKCYRKYKREYVAAEIERLAANPKVVALISLLYCPLKTYSLALLQRPRQTKRIKAFIDLLDENPNISAYCDRSLITVKSAQTIYEIIAEKAKTPNFISTNRRQFGEIPFPTLSFIDFSAKASETDSEFLVSQLQKLPSFYMLYFTSHLGSDSDRVFGHLCFEGTAPTVEILYSLNLNIELAENVYTSNEETHFDFGEYKKDEIVADIQYAQRMLSQLFRLHEIDFAPFEQKLLAEKPEKAFEIVLLILFHAFHVNIYFHQSIVNLKQFYLFHGANFTYSGLQQSFESNISVSSLIEPITAIAAIELSDLPKLYSNIAVFPAIEERARIEVEIGLAEKFIKKDELFGCFVCPKFFQNEMYIMKHFRERHSDLYHCEKQKVTEKLRINSLSDNPSIATLLSFERLYCHRALPSPESVKQYSPAPPLPVCQLIIDFGLV